MKKPFGFFEKIWNQRFFDELEIFWKFITEASVIPPKMQTTRSLKFLSLISKKKKKLEP
jgi:hypothetical protein